MCAVCPPHTSLHCSSVPWLLSHHNTWLQTPTAPNSSVFPRNTLPLWEMSLGTSPSQGGKRKESNGNTSHEWWWFIVSFSDLICLYSSNFLLIPTGLVLLLPVGHSRLQMITSRCSNRKLLLGSILGLFSVYSCINKITSLSSLRHKRQPSNKHFQETCLILQLIYNRH